MLRIQVLIMLMIIVSSHWELWCSPCAECLAQYLSVDWVPWTNTEHSCNFGPFHCLVQPCRVELLYNKKIMSTATEPNSYLI